MKDSLEKAVKHLSERIKQLENLPDDNFIKQEWKSERISDETAIYLLELDEHLKK